jgi:hypothetical protein
MHMPSAPARSVIHILRLQRHTLLGIAGLTLALVGLAALWLPVYLDQYDIYGIKVNCGNGFSSHVSQSLRANCGELVDECHTALLTRRARAIPAVVIGWLLVAGFLFGWVRRQPKEDAAST